MTKLTFIAAVLCGLLTCCCQRPAPMDQTVEKAIRSSILTLERSASHIQDSLSFPTYGKDGQWQTRSSRDWVSGFYGGCLWYAYALTGRQDFESLARKWTMAIEEEKYNTHTHDLGFRFMCTFGNGIRFSPDEAFQSFCRDIRDTAAVTLSKRFHPEFGALSSDWDRKPIEGTTPCVIDIMMNLEILFEAALSTGDHTLYEIATKHADTTWDDFVRPDGGTYHIVRYDKETGEIIDRGQLQGDTKESTWSRGHAWMVYGMVVAYRYTKESRYLEYATSAADYFIEHLNADGIAPWDFQSDDSQTDASASAIVASALYEMSRYQPKRKALHYRGWADRMLETLCSPDYFVGDKTDCLLDHSVQYYHLDHNVNRPAIFADYYFIEALYRYRSIHNRK